MNAHDETPTQPTPSAAETSAPATPAPAQAPANPVAATPDAVPTIPTPAVETSASAPAANPTPTPTPDVSVDDQLQAELDAAMGEGGLDALVEQSIVEATPDPAAAPPTKPGAPVSQTIVRAKIASLRGEDVFADIIGGLPLSNGAKLQGIVPGAQFERAPRVGSIMDFVLDRIDEASGLAYLSREGAVSLAAWDNIVRGTVVEARCVKTNKGGLELEMPHGVNAFMPASQVDIFHVDDLEQFVGQKLTASVAEVNRRAKKVMLSRRNYLEIERAQKSEKLMAELEVGQERKGVV
ncbi:MAG: S1 RNA-binding domain-containing protein, partial [Algisphaera sp.]